MGELEAFYASRRKVTVVIALASVLQAILFGSSVLIEGLTTTFDQPGRNYAFHGLYAKVLIAPVANMVAEYRRLRRAEKYSRLLVCRVSGGQRSDGCAAVRKSKFYGVFVLTRRVGLVHRRTG